MKVKTRATAKLDGDKTYFTGTPCKYGHLSYRYTQSGACNECINGHRQHKINLISEEDKIYEVAAAKARRAFLDSLILIKCYVYHVDVDTYKAAIWATTAARLVDVTVADLRFKQINSEGDLGFYSHLIAPEDIEQVRQIATILRRAHPQAVLMTPSRAAAMAAQFIPATDDTPPINFK